MDRAWADLGLSPGASQDSIKQAYRKLVLQYHPDRHASSSIGDQEAAAARFKVITEAYDLLTDERARAAYHTSSRSSSSAGAYSYHHNVNTDWSQSHYRGGSSSGYTSRMSRWDWYRRFASAGVRSFSQTFHVGLAVLLIGGGLVFEFSHTAIWQARNRGKSFEEMQQAIRAQQESKAASTSSSTAATGSSATGSSSSIDGSNKAGDISSAWADGMRGRFVSADSSSDHKT